MYKLKKSPPTYLKSTKTFPILYVDDEESNLYVFESAFSDDFQVICVSSAAEAIEILKKEQISVLVSDNRMPQMTGVELCEYVSQNYPEVLRILVTGYTDQETVIDAINRGEVMRYITKPWDNIQVRQILKSAVDRYHLESMVRKLRTAILDRERQSCLAATRHRILHNLTDVNAIVAACCSNLETLLPQLEGNIGFNLYAEFDTEVRHLRVAVNCLTQLHEKTNVMTKLEQPIHAYYKVLDVLKTVSEVCRMDLQGIAQFKYECPPDFLMWVDRVSVSRILLTMITNAKDSLRDTGTKDGVIQLKVKQEGKWVHIYLSDNGQGIDSVARSQIFSPFYTTHGDNSTRGLGLAIARELALHNHGHIELVESTEEKGTVFLLKLPATHTIQQNL